MSVVKMKFPLYYPQYVLFRHNRISFCHTLYHRVILTSRQFENLNDVIDKVEMLKLKAYPLGDGLWLRREHDTLCLTAKHVYFVFHYWSWQQYKSNVHPAIYHQLHHGEREARKRNADNECPYLSKSRSAASTARRKAVSRTARNAFTTDEQWQKRSTVSARHSTIPRSHVSSRSAENERRTSSTASNFNSASTSNFESSDECSIEEGELSENDSKE